MSSLSQRGRVIAICVCMRARVWALGERKFLAFPSVVCDGLFGENSDDFDSSVCRQPMAKFSRGFSSI